MSHPQGRCVGCIGTQGEISQGPPPPDLRAVWGLSEGYGIPPLHNKEGGPMDGGLPPENLKYLFPKICCFHTI